MIKGILLAFLGVFLNLNLSAGSNFNLGPLGPEVEIPIEIPASGSTNIKPEDPQECANFSGTWVGTCKTVSTVITASGQSVSQTHETESTRVIKQDACKSIKINNATYYFGQAKVTGSFISAGAHDRRDRATMEWWGKDKKSLFYYNEGNQKGTNEAGDNLTAGGINFNRYWFDGKALKFEGQAHYRSAVPNRKSNNLHILVGSCEYHSSST